jgi:hypothetical protein
MQQTKVAVIRFDVQSNSSSRSQHNKHKSSHHFGTDVVVLTSSGLVYIVAPKSLDRMYKSHSMCYAASNCCDGYSSLRCTVLLLVMYTCFVLNALHASDL